MSIELLIKRLHYAEQRFGLLQEGAVLVRFFKSMPEAAVPTVSQLFNSFVFDGLRRLMNEELEGISSMSDPSWAFSMGRVKRWWWAMDVEDIRNESDPSFASLSSPPPPFSFYESMLKEVEDHKLMLKEVEDHKLMLKEVEDPSFASLCRLYILMLEKVEGIPNALDQFLKLESENAEDIPNALDQFLKLESENAEDILKEFDKFFPDSEATKSEAADDLIFICSAQSPEFIWSFRKRIEELLQKITNLAAKLQNSGNDVGSKGGDNIRGEGNDKVSSGDNNNGGGGDDNRDDGDGDDNNGGGGRDNDGGSGGNDMKKDGGNDYDGNSDKDKGGSSSSDRKRMGNQMDFMGEPGFGYRYGYHAGDENGIPVGQLHHPKKVKS